MSTERVLPGHPLTTERPNRRQLSKPFGVAGPGLWSARGQPVRPAEEPGRTKVQVEQKG